MTFMIGEDMSYIENMLKIIKEYNPLSKEVELEDEKDIDLDQIFEKFNQTTTL